MALLFGGWSGVLESLVLVRSSSLWHRCMSVVWDASVRGSLGDRVFFFCGEVEQRSLKEPLDEDWDVHV